MLLLQVIPPCGKLFRMAAQLHPRDVKIAMGALRADLARAWRIDDLAKICGVARRTLEKHFQQFVGCRPVEFLRDERLKQARRKLLRARPGANVTAIAGEGLLYAKIGSLRRTDMKFRPLHDRVVVTRIDAQAKTAGGIIIPDTVKEKPTEGEVIAVGPGGRDESGKLIPIDRKQGDKVLFGKWSGTEVKIDGVEYLIMKESDIMGVIEQASARAKAA
jgi:chaperonin GroES